MNDDRYTTDSPPPEYIPPGASPRRGDEGPFYRIRLRRTGPTPPRKPDVRINLLLFILTVITTTLAGAMQQGVNPFASPGEIYTGIPFSFTLLLILGVHELGHYLMSRRHGGEATLPYFIPAPHFIGTFGAFIKMRSRPADRRVLLDIGAAGPIAGFILAVPAVIIGVYLSEVKPTTGEGGLMLGSSILFSVIEWFVKGPLPEGMDIYIHPIGFAGWIGLFVTSLNLLPLGQLDGGHIAYALLDEQHETFGKYVAFALVVLGLIGWKGWLFWALLVTFVLGLRHPPPVYPYVPLDSRRRTIAWICFGILIVTFIPNPFSIMAP